MSKQTQLSLLFFAPYLLAVILAANYIYSLEKNSRTDIFIAEENQEIALAANSISNEIKYLKDEILVLSQSKAVKSAIETENEQSMETLTQAFLLSLIHI